MSLVIGPIARLRTRALCVSGLSNYECYCLGGYIYPPPPHAQQGVK